ncbi:hypothetical protein DTO027B5_6369 [Paecilomyces variotii]|nr:hypothetical protein DTO169C6_5973 [Paecilomyces variotii]KAJ9248560.1 hypothetical protein DTO207G8_7339 [Paecilomyces variotii]KAJ9329820.1 hypothetical protein DTO027B3_307 [Paecilomyces variotii]KAJ9331838.1 hypothetical protein DTO027B5_6369 [Paecilomyces variotii]KAJ9379693.1 hypothetical protein DTO063F5_7064 [Paecilomyces variotii]
MSAEKKVLVTGASGFVAAHIIQVFLEAGYAVKGTVRSESTAEKVRSTYPKYADKLSFAIVPDMAVPDAFDEAVKGVEGIIHTATPFQIQVEDNERDLLRPAIDGTVNILRSAKKFAPQVRRVVIISSFAAIGDFSKGNRPGYTYTEADWNPMSYEEAAKKETPGALAYCAAKALAERSAWDFIKNEKPNFDLVTLCPPMVYGPNINATTDLSKLNTSSADIYQLMAPGRKPTDEMPQTSFWSWVDVRDVALAHLRAYEIPEAGNQRFFLCNGNFSYQMMCDILRENIPELRDRVPIGKPGSGFGGVELYKTDASKAEKVLGIKFRPLEVPVVDAARSFLELEKKGGKA